MILSPSCGNLTCLQELELRPLHILGKVDRDVLNVVHLEARLHANVVDILVDAAEGFSRRVEESGSAEVFGELGASVVLPAQKKVNLLFSMKVKFM